MGQIKKYNGAGYHNPHLIVSGLVAALGGLLIYSTIAMIGILLIQQ